MNLQPWWITVTLLSVAVAVVSGKEDSDEELPHAGCRGLLKDRQPAHPPLVGAEYEAIMLATKVRDPDDDDTYQYHMKNEAGATAATCTNGNAGGYTCSGVDLLSVVPLSQMGESSANDVWGWTSSDGREFALIGLRAATGIVEITNPTSPVYFGKLPTQGSGSSWRDVKTYGNYMYVGSEEGGHGMQILDLTQLLTLNPSQLPKSFTNTGRYTGFSNSHNLFINEDSGFAYAVGASTCNGGLSFVNLSNPTNPSNAGCYSADGYTHDVQCVLYDGPDTSYKGREICFASNEDTLTIVDVTNKNNPQQLSRTGYANDRYTHQGWLTEDSKYFIFNDELDERGYGGKTRTHVYDVSDLDSPVYKQYYSGRTNAVDHNNYVVDNYVFQANYRAGLEILQINNLQSNSASNYFDHKGYFDVHPNSDSNGFNGAWSTYPFFPSRNILISSIESGLFVVKFNEWDPEDDNPTASPTRTPTASPTNGPTLAPSKCPSGKALLEVEFLADNKSDKENSLFIKQWNTKKDKFQKKVIQIKKNKIKNSKLNEKDSCVDVSGCYLFQMVDKKGNGLKNDGHYKITFDDVLLKHTLYKYGKKAQYMFSHPSPGHSCPSSKK